MHANAAKVIGNQELKPHLGWQALLDVKTKANDEVQLMNPSTEACICILMENNHQKLVNIKSSDKGWDLKPGSRKADNSNAMCIDCLWSDQKKGSDPCLSFSPVGIRKFNEWRLEIEKHREENEERVELIDQMILDEHRKLRNLTGKTKKEEKKLAKNRMTEEEAKVQEEELDEGDDW